MKKGKNHIGYQPTTPGDVTIPLDKKMSINTEALKQMARGSADFTLRPFVAGGVKTTLALLANMTNAELLSRLVTQPLTDLAPQTPEEMFTYLQEGLYASTDLIVVEELGRLYFLIANGFVVFIIDGMDKALAIGLQGFSFRGVSEPDSEANIRGGKEGFVEPLRVNMSLLRRRMKTPFMTMEVMTIGDCAKNDLCLVYRTDMVNKALVAEVKKRIKKIKIDNIQSAGYIRPFLEDGRPSLFSGVGSTERPDTLAAKIGEGRIGILVDGTPFALIIPFLFNEHFQSLDDYSGRPYYATLVRAIKYLSFFVSILLPGIFVAVVRFNLELLPSRFMYTILSSRGSLPFSVGVEAVLIFLIYEMLKEAGLRMPKEVGHVVSFVGALVVGDAAVRAGIVSIPMLMVVALTAISSYVAPSLYETTTFLRLGFIIIGSFFGVVGVFMAFGAVMADLFGLTVLGIPVMTPFSPFTFYAMRDTVVRLGWRKLSKERFEVSTPPEESVE